MFKLLKPKSRSLLGIDISSSAIKIMEITYDQGQYWVDGYGSMPLPEGSMEGASIKDFELISNGIKTILANSKMKCKLAAVSVPDSATISKVIQITSGLSDSEVEELVVMEAEKYIPYPINEINLDFDTIGVSEKNEAMLDILIVASRSENVSKRYQSITQAGLEVKIVDVESFAIERAVQLLIPQLFQENESKRLIAIIDIGAIYTHFFVLHGDKVIFSREEEFGGRQLVDSMMQQYNLAEDKVFQAFESNQFPAGYEKDVLEPFNELMLLQVKRALQFFSSTSHHTTVDHILLAGGIAKQPGIEQVFKDQLNIPTTVANPFEYMSLSPTLDKDSLYRDSPGLLVACGLAMRASE